MMNIDDVYFQLIMMPFQTLNIKYEIRKNGNTYEGIINIKEFRKMFRNTLGKMSAVKLDDNTIQLMKTGDMSNIKVEEDEQGIKLKMGEIGEISLTDDKLAEKLNETFREQFGDNVTVTKKGDTIVVTVVSPQKVFLNVLNKSNSPLKLENGKLVFKL
jgi:NMD protein affecting ribosome stability and mRNA decay